MKQKKMINRLKCLGKLISEKKQDYEQDCEITKMWLDAFIITWENIRYFKEKK